MLRFVYVRQWFQIDRAWVERREALLRAEEDRVIREARDRATGEERAFLEELIATRARNNECQTGAAPDMFRRRASDVLQPGVDPIPRVLRE